MRDPGSVSCNHRVIALLRSTTLSMCCTQVYKHACDDHYEKISREKISASGCRNCLGVGEPVQVAAGGGICDNVFYNTPRLS